jgi:hypothetical protein
MKPTIFSKTRSLRHNRYVGCEKKNTTRSFKINLVFMHSRINVEVSISFVISVRQSACLFPRINVASTGHIFVKFDVGDLEKI